MTDLEKLDDPPCPACASKKGNTSFAARSYVYAVGTIRPRFPKLSVEKEYAQLVGRESSAGDGASGSDRKLFYDVLQNPQNQYLIRQMCWVFSIEGIDTYILFPANPVDYTLFSQALRENPSSLDVDVIIGSKGPIAPSEMCNGLMIPIVLVDQTYSFDRPALSRHIVQSLRGEKSEKDKALQESSEELFDRITGISDNAGNSDEHRALNYLAVRYDRVYAVVAEQHLAGNSLQTITVRRSQLSGTRKVVDVSFSFTNRKTDVSTIFGVRVDVTEKFPFLVTKLTPTLEIFTNT